MNWLARILEKFLKNKLGKNNTIALNLLVGILDVISLVFLHVC